MGALLSEADLGPGDLSGAEPHRGGPTEAR